MAENQKKYIQEFKQQLVDLYNTGNYSFPQRSSEYNVIGSVRVYARNFKAETINPK